MDFHSWETVIMHLPIDWIIIGVAVVLVAIDALRSGSARAASLVLSLPATLLLVSAIPQAFFLEPFTAKLTAPMAQTGIFAVVFVALYFATHRIIFSFSEGGKIIQALIAGVAATVVLMVIWLQVPALDSLWHFGSQVQAVFGPAYRFWWLVGAFIGLVIARS